MNFFKFLGKNWKTSLAGAVAIVGAFPTIAPYVPIVNQIIETNPQTKQDWLATAIMAAAAGLFAAKDHNVTGGSVRQ